MSLSIIAAVSRNGVIGKGKRLPWNMPSDLQRFKEMTGNRIVVLGPKTYLSLPGRLAKRAVVVYSRREKPRIVTMHGSDFYLTDSLDEIVPIIEGNLPDIDPNEIFIGGGEGIFHEFMPKCDRMYITEIDCEIKQGDTFFPAIGSEWKIVQEMAFDPQAGDDYSSTFRVYERSR